MFGSLLYQTTTAVLVMTAVKTEKQIKNNKQQRTKTFQGF